MFAHEHTQNKSSNKWRFHSFTRSLFLAFCAFPFSRSSFDTFPNKHSSFCLFLFLFLLFFSFSTLFSYFRQQRQQNNINILWPSWVFVVRLSLLPIIFLLLFKFVFCCCCRLVFVFRHFEINSSKYCFCYLFFIHRRVQCAVYCFLFPCHASHFCYCSCTPISTKSNVHDDAWHAQCKTQQFMRMPHVNN